MDPEVCTAMLTGPSRLRAWSPRFPGALSHSLLAEAPRTVHGTSGGRQGVSSPRSLTFSPRENITQPTSQNFQHSKTKTVPNIQVCGTFPREPVLPLCEKRRIPS
ncbi:hypothetical protein NL108_006027 [Boleophthalmus pectinirostris]|nr:hypothetical protein NL108_006027 [Boleophthalmus pectinirostris]